MEKHKIFDDSVVKYLKDDFGITDQRIAEIKFRVLKEFAVNRLRKVAELIEAEEFEEVRQYLNHSGYGTCSCPTNTFIDFEDIFGTYWIPNLETNGCDIGNVTDELKKFKQIKDNELSNEDIDLINGFHY